MNGETKDIPEYFLYCDGGCHGSGSPNSVAGWAYVIRGSGFSMRSGNFRTNHSLNATNNQAEVVAAIEGLRAVPEKECVKVISDSKILLGWIERFNEGTFYRKTKLSHELLAELKAEVVKRRVTTERVKGHNGDKWNELCDEAARDQIELSLNHIL